MSTELQSRHMHSHTILAALRCYQKRIGLDQDIDNIATNHGKSALPSPEAIDELCEALNGGDLELKAVQGAGNTAKCPAERLTTAVFTREELLHLREKLQEFINSDVDIFGEKADLKGL